MSTLFTLERFDRPAWLWLALLIALLWWMARRSLAGLGPVRGRLCMIMRAVVVIVLVLVIAGTHKIKKNDDLSVLFLLDESRSVPAEVRKQGEQFIKSACADMRPNDRAAVLTFDGLTNIEQLPARPGPEGGLHIPLSLAEGQSPDRTNIAQALRMAAACAPDSTNNRVVILSDGNQNVGDLLGEAKTAWANKITVDVLPLRFEHGAEVINEELRAPAYANLHEQISLNLILKSDRQTSGMIYVYQRVGQKEELLDLDPGSAESGIRKTLSPGRNAFTVRVPINEARGHEFRSEFIPDDKDADAIPQNNVARAFTNIEDKQTVLYVGMPGEKEQAEDAMLVEALEREKINVDLETVDSVGLDTSVLQNYAAVILANVPAESFSAAQQQALATYVRDLGGGLIMTGGDMGFGAGGWQGSVVEDIMPVRFDVDEVRQIQRGALAIVMHSCEMPQGNKWGIEVGVAALQTLSRLDYFGVVGYTNTGEDWEVKMQMATNKDAIIKKLRAMQNGDMPDFDSSMELAYKGLTSCKDAAQRHMIIISDGDASGPSTTLIHKLVRANITCSTVAIFPHGGRADPMTWIANATKGRSYLLTKAGDEKKLPKIFTKEARVVRRPLLCEELFKPRSKPSLSDVMTGIQVDDMPELGGYVVTTPRKVVDVEMPLITKRGDPLLAHWRCGFGRTLAFTSGEWQRWGGEWPAWAGFSKLWAQAVRWAMQQGTAADFDVSTSTEGNEGHILIEAVDEEKGFIAGGFVAKVVGPDGVGNDLPVSQTGPGRYEARFKVDQMGTYLATILSADAKAEKPVQIRTGLTLAYSPEFKDLTTNEALLDQAADETQGRVLSLKSEANTVFAHTLPPVISRSPIWDRLLQIAVFLFLVDVAVRRIAFDPVKLLVSTRSYITSLAGQFGVGGRAAETLTDLKSVREKVRAEKTAEGDARAMADARGIPRAIPKPPGPAPDASTKFEAEAARLKKPVRGDLTESLGGAALGPDGLAAPQAAKPQGPQESTTARLLKAKKRAQQQQQDEP